MKEIYGSEIEGMLDFWKELEEKELIRNPFSKKYICNTDGRTYGCLAEFKRDALEDEKNKQQLLRYAKAYNTLALRIPRYGILISLNQRQYKYFDFKTSSFIKEGRWNEPKDLINLIDVAEIIEGWIDAESLVSYSDLYYSSLSYKKSKDDFIEELRDPKFLNIKPYIWDKTGKMEKSLLDQIGPSALKKRLGAFFTPEYASKKTTEYVRNIIKQQPDDNYVIVDRCAGTGNLEQYLTEEELSHCILNTYVYAEWNTLNGLYNGRCIILPEDDSSLQPDGTLSDGDALSEKFCNRLKDLTEGKRIIFLENPPYQNVGANNSVGSENKEERIGKTNNFITEEMSKSGVIGTTTNDLANKFIWSAFEYFNCDYYVVYAPVKYWKSQHLIDKKFLEGFIANRKDFHATEAGIPVISWKNENVENEELVLENCILKKVNNHISTLLPENEKDSFFTLISNNGVLNSLSGFITNHYIDCHAAKREVGEKGIKQAIPLFVANCYKLEGFTEKEIIMKSGDGGLKYLEDEDFINDCIVYTALTNKNKCIATPLKNNEMCFDGSAKLNSFYVPYPRNSLIMNLWNEVIKESKRCDEYNPEYNYGLYQIINELNVKIPQLSVNKTIITNKKGEILYQKKYQALDETIIYFKNRLEDFFEEYIVNKLFEYKLLK